MSMVRKQIYLEKRQDAVLKRIARSRGVSEAEVIRQAIDQAAAGGRGPLDPDAWEEAYQFMRSLGDRQADQRRRDWTRADLYEERLERYGPG